MTASLIPLHMGALHAYEQWLVVAIAFGPFLVLGVVIAIRRRQDLAEDDGDATDPPGPDDRPEGGSAEDEADREVTG